MVSTVGGREWRIVRIYFLSTPIAMTTTHSRYDYDRRLARTGARLETKLRVTANQALDRAGFGGSRKFRKVGEGLSTAFHILAEYGIEPDETLNAHNFPEAKGSRLIHIAFSNAEDSFSPRSIGNSGLQFSWEDLGSSRVEVIAYLS